MLFSLVLPLSVFIYNYEQTDGAAYFRERLNEVKGDLTIDRFARKVGVARATMGGYLAGTRLPKADHLKKIAEKCGVSADYLIGLSDAKGTDNRDISIALGLSDEAIEVLRRSKENPFRHFAYDKIIVDDKILPGITNYLFAFLEYLRLKSIFRVVPCKGVGDGLADRMMVKIMTHLPEWKSNVINEMKKPLMERLLLEYVANVVDEQKCNSIVNEYEYYHEEWPEPKIEFEDEEYEITVEDDFDYDEWLAGCKEAEKEMAIEEQKGQNRYDVIQKVLEYRQKEN